MFHLFMSVTTIKETYITFFSIQNVLHMYSKVIKIS